LINPLKDDRNSRRLASGDWLTASNSVMIVFQYISTYFFSSSGDWQLAAGGIVL
jgi:hypothetical protein